MKQVVVDLIIVWRTRNGACKDASHPSVAAGQVVQGEATLDVLTAFVRPNGCAFLIAADATHITHMAILAFTDEVTRK